MNRRPRVIVCGTIFGQVYLEAFRGPDAPFELAGILARGSDRSNACARHHQVPLFSSVAMLPSDIDLACVVVRSGLLGGRGTELALELMARGIHVLQEHPLHHDELAACLRQANRMRVGYHLNSFYVHVAPTRAFIAAARELVRQRKPLFIEAACGFQVAYALFDILGQILEGVRPWTFSASPSTGSPFRSLEGTLSGVPFMLRIQNQLDPSDPDNHAHLLHRIVIGTGAGSLALADTHGATIWTARPHFPHEVRDAAARPHFAGDSAERDLPAIAIAAHPEPRTAHATFETLWPAAVRRALAALDQARTDRTAIARHGQYHLALCEAWQDATAQLGPPELVRSPAPSPLDMAELEAIVAAAEGAR